VEYPERRKPSLPNDSASRYGPAEDPGDPGFHTYATSELYDTNGGGERWPDNWAHPAAPREIQAPIVAKEPAVKRDYWVPLLWTIGWYAVPALVLVVRALARSGQGRAGALAELLANAPIWVVALAGGLILALVLRWASESWRAATIGFCAAVVSGGAITILYRIW
jgi:hypothetical protein